MTEDAEPAQGTQIIKHDVGQNPEMLPTNRFTIDELKAASALLCLEAAAGIQMGKIKPVGYDEVAGFFRAEYEETTNAQCAWLIAEAEKAGRFEDLERDFPHVCTRAQRLINHMKMNNAPDVAAIITRLLSPCYSVQQVRDIQAGAAKLGEILLKKK